MERTVIINGQEVRMRASALIPRLYRFKFGRDIVNDLRQLQKSYSEVVKDQMSEEEKKDAQLSVTDLTIFENVAWLMCKHADNSIPDSPDEWLDGIDGVVSIYEILPVVMELWAANNKTLSTPRKN